MTLLVNRSGWVAACLKGGGVLYCQRGWSSGRAGARLEKRVLRGSRRAFESRSLRHDTFVNI